MKKQLLYLREILGVKSDEKVARAIGVTLNTVAKWKAGQRAPSILAQEKIDALIKKHSKGIKHDET
jgi:DNA-binding transcriptional regulator YiaG